MTCCYPVKLTRHRWPPWREPENRLLAGTMSHRAEDSTYIELLSNVDTITYRKRKRCSTYGPCTRTAIMFCPLPLGPPCSPRHAAPAAQEMQYMAGCALFFTHTRNHYLSWRICQHNPETQEMQYSIIRVGVRVLTRYYSHISKPLFPGPRRQNESRHIPLDARDAVHPWSAWPFILPLLSRMGMPKGQEDPSPQWRGLSGAKETCRQISGLRQSDEEEEQK